MQLVRELAPSLSRVWLVRLSDYKFDTIAAALGISEGTARKYASEAKRIVHERREDERVTPPPFRTPQRAS